MSDRPALHLLSGGLDPEVRLLGTSIVAAPRSSPPFAVDAVVEEEDTYLVLSADPQVRAPREPLMRVLTDVLEARPEVPGSVVERRGRPPRWLAVVHDLSADPTWREEWIEAALGEVFRRAARRRLPSLALPLLGTVHGRLPRRRCLELIHRAVDRAAAAGMAPRRLWLVVPEEAAGSVARAVRSIVELREAGGHT